VKREPGIFGMEGRGAMFLDGLKYLEIGIDNPLGAVYIVYTI
jgi:hypothetical protein